MKVLSGILGIFPSILQGIVAVEGAVGPGNGATKKQLILSAVDAASKVGESVPIPVVSAISLLIDGIVSELNHTGALPKPAPPPST